MFSRQKPSQRGPRPGRDPQAVADAVAAGLIERRADDPQLVLLKAGLSRLGADPPTTRLFAYLKTC
jgi:hypothetical protein